MIRMLACLLCVLALPAMAAARVLDIQYFKTEKGIQVWMVEDHSLPVIALSFAFRTGAAIDPVEKQGISQLLSNTLDEGAGDIKSEAFQDALRNQAISLSYNSSRDSFGGELQTLARHKDEAFKLLKLSVNNPRFDPEPVQRMKDANVSRILGGLGDSAWIEARLLYDRMFANHPYAMNTGGTLAGMKTFTAADLRAARARHFSRDNLVIGIAGDISKEDAGKVIDDIFGTLPGTSKRPGLTRSEMPPAGKPAFYAKQMPQTELSMAWRGIPNDDPDHYAAQVMDYIFGGGGFASLLMNEVREAKGLTYGIYSSEMNLDYADRFVVQGSMLPQNVQPTIDAVRRIAKSMVDSDVDAGRLQAAKDYLIGSMPLHFGSTGDIAGALTGLQLNHRPVTALDDFRDKINAVTAADIRRVASRIFAAEPMIVLVGARPEGMDVETVTTLPNAETSKAPVKK